MGNFAVTFLLLISFCLLVGCGGGSDGDSGSNTNTTLGSEDPFDSNDQPEPDPPQQINETLESASRFLAMATLGADFEEIERVASIGKENWIDEQFQQPIGLNLPFTLDLLRKADLNGSDKIDRRAFRRYSWWQQVMTSPDLLRQRVAFALSEIFVVSDRLDMLGNHPEALSSYYDVLLTHSFGNFEDLLLDVTLHPAMGVYLSHINNKKANPEKGTFPDENYARESMQLLSIGLNLLNPDGTEMRDSSGNLIPTYDNSDITEFARVFTGLVSAEPRTDIDTYINLVDFMVMNEDQHDTEEKSLLNGTVLPAGQTGLQDISDAVNNLFNHPNTGPFICKQLIKRFVTSNPDPDYVKRVADVFADNGLGVRGDMKAVLKAIFLDEDAVDSDQSQNSSFGKFHEPWIRYVSLLRAFNASTFDNFYYNTGELAQLFLQQHPLSAPSVFNFFLPNFLPNGIIGERNLTAPEFQIMTSSTIVNYPNLVFIMLFEGELMSIPDQKRFFLPVTDAVFDFTDELELAANDPEALIDRLDILLTYGGMSDGTKQIVTNAALLLEDPFLRLSTALYLILISPDYVVQN